ncbi:MAG: hypothetical protein K6B15_09575 [Parasporobacterium sp.]|nr:hypothetical protein [Parasporobacterium sp.]
MTREISIQSILIGMLKKWLLLLIVFIVFAALALGYNVYKARGEARTANAKTVATDEGTVEQTVTTKAGAVLTVSQLNRAIHNLQQQAEYYENYLSNSYKMQGSNSRQTTTRIYIVSTDAKDAQETRLLVDTIALALQNDVYSTDFIDSLANSVQGMKMDFINEVIGVDSVNGCVQVSVSYLDDDMRAQVMSLVSQRIEATAETLKAALGGFDFTMLSETQSERVEAEMSKSQVDIYTALQNTLTQLTEYTNLALTVESKAEVGVIKDEQSLNDTTIAEDKDVTATDDTKAPSSTATPDTFSWRDMLGKKEIAISVAVGIVMALIVGFIYVAYGARKVLSVYDVLDVSTKDVAIAVTSAKAGALDKSSLKKCPGIDDEMTYVRIIKTAQNFSSKRLLIDLGENELDADTLSKIKEAFAGKGLDIVVSSDFAKRADFVSAWTKEDACLVLSHIGKTQRKELFERVVQYNEAGVEVIGNIVLA